MVFAEKKIWIIFLRNNSLGEFFHKLIWSPCSADMENNVKSAQTFETFEWLLSFEKTVNSSRQGSMLQFQQHFCRKKWKDGGFDSKYSYILVHNKFWKKITQVAHILRLIFHGIFDDTEWVGLDFGRSFHKLIWGRCYDDNFLRFLPIFGEKIGVFLKYQCYDQFFSKCSFVLSKKRQFFR
jgi:hypothetical protein